MGPTMVDVAREAGVGVATVDRVINKRASVSQDTAERVLAAAEKLGFRRAGLIRHRIDEKTSGYRLGFILQKSSTPFYQELGTALETATHQLVVPAGRAMVSFLQELTPEHIVHRLYELSKKADAIAVVAADHPLVSQAIDDIAARGIPVFALVSDLSAESCSGYVGMDHRKVGRTAAWAITGLAPQPGKVGIIVGSHRYLCQEQSEMSFRAYFREHAPEFQLLETLISLEDIPLAQVATLELLKQHPDLTGLYIAGGGIEGVIQALKAGQARRELVTVCLDLTSITRQALIDRRINMVLSHPQEWLAGRLVETMVQAIQNKAPRGSLQSTLPFITYTAANV